LERGNGPKKERYTRRQCAGISGKENDTYPVTLMWREGQGIFVLTGGERYSKKKKKNTTWSKKRWGEKGEDIFPKEKILGPGERKWVATTQEKKRKDLVSDKKNERDKKKEGETGCKEEESHSKLQGNCAAGERGRSCIVGKGIAVKSHLGLPRIACPGKKRGRKSANRRHLWENRGAVSLAGGFGARS